jgi:Resolvase, N terminal domain
VALIRKPSLSMPTLAASLVPVPRPRWSPYEDPRLSALADAYDLLRSAVPGARNRSGPSVMMHSKFGLDREGTMRVATYARVSSESQEARGTIGSQLEALREKVSELGHEIVHEYTDDGYSGARLDRPGLDALSDAAELGLFKQVWCLTPDRLARSYAYQILITDEAARGALHPVPAPMNAGRAAAAGSPP